MRERMEMTRPMLWPCSPPGSPHPQIRSSIWAVSSSGTFSSTFVTTYAARSSGLTSTSEPFRALPIGERPNATITASVMDRDYGPVGKTPSVADLPPGCHFPLAGRVAFLAGAAFLGATALAGAAFLTAAALAGAAFLAGTALAGAAFLTAAALAGARFSPAGAAFLAGAASAGFSWPETPIELSSVR